MGKPDLLQRIRTLEASRKRDAKKLASKAATIKRLRVLLRTAVAFEVEADSDDDDDDEGSVNTCGVKDKDDKDEDDDDDDEDEDEDEDMENETVEPPRDSETPTDSDAENDIVAETAIWDAEDKVYRCKECLFEVEEGYCRRCNKVYDWDANDPRNKETVSVDSDATSIDRCTTMRGTTPLLISNSEPLNPVALPSPYRGRKFEYSCLIQRGATADMCETFNLEYTRQDGIVAWADQDIFNAFSGPGMAGGDKWKIYLGRRIQLDKDDKDGSQFLEGLLEDILFYPVENRNIQWRTFEEVSGIWATRANMLYDADDDAQNEDIINDKPEDDDKIYEDDGAHIPQNIYANADWQRLYDAALEFPFRPNDQPFLEMDEYETEDDDDDDETQGSIIEEDKAEDDDPSASIVATVPDTVYKGGDEDEDEDEDEEDEGNVGQEDESMQDLEGEVIVDSDSEPGSDWDSDEELSGDEEVMRPRKKI